MPLAGRVLNPEAEQYLAVMKGEVPLWVPRASMLIGPVNNKYSTTMGNAKSLRTSAFPRRTARDGSSVDIFGVKHVQTAETGGASLPEPNNFILGDIRKWRDVIKTPDLSSIDWELQCKRDMDGLGNIAPYVLTLGTHVGYFQHLMNFMGFNNGLIAMAEEPEEVKALYEYLSDFYCGVLEEQMKYWGEYIDELDITDDTATARSPFISPQMYRELVKPYAARLAKYGTDRGMHIMMHNCGRCEDSIEDWRDFGVNGWNPAQVENDLDGIKAKYGNSLVLIGCWDSQGPVGWPHATEELIREEVRKCMMHYCKGGGFMFAGSFYGPVDDEDAENRKRWITEAYEDYREEPYK